MPTLQPNNWFSEETFVRDPARVYAFAAANGHATVLGANGKPKFTIGYPKPKFKDLEE